MTFRRLFACAVLLGTVAAARAAERPRADRLLPDSTLAMISVPSAPELAQRFMNTALGRMMQDPQMKPLVDQLYGSLAEMVADPQVKDRVGLTLPELLALPQGEVTVALVPVKDASPAVVVILDAGSQIGNVRKLLERGAAALDQLGVKKNEETVSGTKIISYSDVSPESPNRKASYFEKDDTLVVATDAEALKPLLATWNGEKTPTLAGHAHYAAIMNRCRGGKDEAPQVFWYVDPVGILRTLGEQNVGTRIVVAMLPALGVDGLSGVGGTMAWDAGQFDSLMHAHLLLENPRSGVVKMLALEPGDTKPERWAPADVAQYMTLHWNVEATYKALATLYDSFRGDGALSRDVQQRVNALIEADFEKELLPALEGRITTLAWIDRPATFESQMQLYAFKLKNTEPFQKALDKAVEKYPGQLVKKTYGSKTYLQTVMPERPAMPDGQRPPEPPVPCFGIVDDYLVITTRPKLFEKVLTLLGEGGKTLADELDFKLISSKIQRHCGGTKPALIQFNRPEESLRFYYDLATAERTRERLARGAENNRFVRSVDTALKQNPLPPFSVLQRYLAPGGAVVIDDDTGIHYTAFSLRRKAE